MRWDREMNVRENLEVEANLDFANTPTLSSLSHETVFQSHETSLIIEKTVLNVSVGREKLCRAE